MNIIDTAHATVAEYPGGSEALGPRIGMSPAVLRNKVNPNNTTHHLTLVEAARIMAVSGDHRILHALAAELDHVALPIAAGEGVDDTLLDLTLSQSQAQGDFAAALQQALADGAISENEMRAIASAAAGKQAALTLLLRRVHEMHQASTRGPVVAIRGAR